MKRTLLLLCSILVAITACNEPVKETAKSEKELDLLCNAFITPDSNKDSVIALSNSLWNNYPNLSVTAKYKYYSMHSNYYAEYNLNMRKALLYCDSAINVLSFKGGYFKELAEAYYSKGDVLLELGNYNEAFDSYFQSKKYIDKVNDNCTSGSYSYRIAMVLYKQKKFDDARFFFRKGMQEIIKCKDNEYLKALRVQQLYNSIALTFTNTKQLDSAVVWYRKGLVYLNEVQKIDPTAHTFKISKAVFYGNLGGVLINQGKFEEGETLLLKSISINDKPKSDRGDALTAKLKLIGYYLTSKRFLDAKHFINQVDTSAVLKKLEHKQQFYTLKTKYFIETGDKSKALDVLIKANDVRDSLQKQLDVLNAIDLTDRFDYLKVEQKVDDLTEERNFHQLLIIIISVFVGIAVILLVLIYFYWNKARKALTNLGDLNNQVTKQNVKLERALKEIGNSDREKDGILRTVAHDLRNPIAGITTMIDIMAEEDATEHNAYKFELMKGACSSALTLINDLIEAAENKEKINIDNYKTQEDYIALVKHSINFASFKAKEKMQTISFTSTLDSFTIFVYKEKIARVLSNLIYNAIKFSTNGTNITVKVTLQNKYICTSIIDEGIGIPDANKDDIFMTFTQVKRFGTKGEKSHGLGLSICKQIVESHKGKIWVEDNPKGGSIFYFLLPI